MSIAGNRHLPSGHEYELDNLENDQTEQPHALHLEHFGLVDAVLPRGRLSDHDLQNGYQENGCSEAPLHHKVYGLH